MIEGEEAHESIGPDVQRINDQSIPPLDVHSDSTTKDCHVQSSTSSNGLSTPSTIHEEKVRDQDEKDVELPPNSRSTIHEEKVQDQDEKDVELPLDSPSTIDEEKVQDQDEEDIELAQATSTAESVYPPPVKVPIAERRGLFARFSILAEIEEPKHYPQKTKWFITFIIALGAVAAPLGSAIIFRESFFNHDAISFAYVVCLRDLLTSFPSCLTRHRSGSEYYTHRYQSFSRILHAQHVDISSLVVLILRGTRSPDNIPCIIRPLLAIQYPGCSLPEHLDAGDY